MCYLHRSVNVFLYFSENINFPKISIMFLFLYIAGAMMWWGPEFAFLGAKAACGAKAGCENITQADISKKFGVVMAVAGLLGENFSTIVWKAF